MTATIRPITFAEWREKIAPMWDVEPQSIPIVNNPYRVIQYPVGEWHHRICFIPVEYAEDGVVVGYNSIYNVSDTTLRFRGIYVLPEHRGRGVGHRMCLKTAGLFQAPFHRVIGFYKAAGVQRFLDHGEMRYAPISPLWSEFSKTKLYVLYRDREPAPDSDLIENNRRFIDHNLHTYGFGGSNNLNCSWSDAEWLEFVKNDAESYPDVGLRLDF